MLDLFDVEENKEAVKSYVGDWLKDNNLPVGPVSVTTAADSDVWHVRIPHLKVDFDIFGPVFTGKTVEEEVNEGLLRILSKK